jgi:CheY-like chemotaxis protein
VYTEPGKGTTFNVYLPSTRDADGLSRSGASDAEAEASPHILFVDDDAQVLEMESIRLQRLGYRVTTCPSGDDALHALRTDASAFDLVLTDYAMPEMTGLELTEALSKQGFEVPIVLMSGFSAQVSEADVRNSGVEMFLRKPVGSSELETALSVVL